MSRRTRTLAEAHGGVTSEEREAAIAASSAAAVRDAVESVPARGPDDLAAAAEIRAWFLTLRTIGTAAETAVMRACWRMRQAHPEQDDFGRFVFNELEGCMTPRKAWLLADTWEVARKNRKVHELAASQPDRAVAFVRDFTDAVEAAGGRAENLPLPLDDDDREIVALLTAPPKKRREKLRDLVAARRAPRDHHPDDIQQIEDLQAALAAREHAASEPAGPAALREAVEALAAVEAPALEALRKVAEALKAIAGDVPDFARQRVLRICDRVGGSLDETTAAAHWSPPGMEGDK